MPLALWALTLSAFAIGTTEFVIVGLVPTIAQDLAISVPSAGLLVSLYALGVAVGAPVLTALTGNWPRKPLLLALMSLCIRPSPDAPCRASGARCHAPESTLATPSHHCSPFSRPVMKPWCWRGY